MKFSAKEIDGLLHIRMTDPSKEELCHDENTGGSGLAFFQMKVASGEQVAMTIVVIRELKKDGVTDLAEFIKDVKEAMSQTTIH